MTDREPQHPETRLPLPSAWGVTALTGLFLLALLAAVGYAQAVLFPIVLAILLNFLLRNPVRWLERAKIPKAVSAAILLLVLVGGLGFGIAQLRQPASEWLANAPQSLAGLERAARRISEPVEKASEAAAQMEDMADVQGEQKRRRGVQRVEVMERSLLETTMAALPEIAFGAVVALVLLYLLLLFDEDILRNVVRVLPTMTEKRRIVQIAREAQATVSRYLLTIALINIALGVAIGAALAWIGVPSPWLWGVMGGLLNFVPYLGGLAGVTIVALVALTTLDSTLYALAAPASYAAINSLEGLVVTPIILGNQFALNPVIIFVWLLLWGWLWGIGGALIAVPLLTVFKIFCDYTPSLSKLGEVLERP